MARQFRDIGITFFDGFAGPGEYTNAQDSSPAIAMEQALRSEVTRWGTQTRLVFVEDHRGRAEHLLETIYKETHVKPVVDPLIAQRRVELVRTGRSYADRVLRLAERQLF